MVERYWWAEEVRHLWGYVSAKCRSSCKMMAKSRGKGRTKNTVSEQCLST